MGRGSFVCSFITGGFDGQLKLFQLEHLTSNTRPPAPIFQHSTDDVISCVSWRTPHCVCCSTDGGQLVLVDTRASRRKKPPLQINTNKQVRRELGQVARPNQGELNVCICLVVGQIPFAWN